MEQKTVGILIFDDVEVLDFAGPFEVFSIAVLPHADSHDDRLKPFRVVTIAERDKPVCCRGGLVVHPHYSIDTHPPLDILVVPGGRGTRREVTNNRLLDWIAEQDKTTSLTTSVCTGAFLLAARGLLDDKPATTHWASLDRLAETHPTITVERGTRYVDTGRVITSAGVSAGIDMALYIVGRLLGEETAQQTAHNMEYERPT